MYPRYPKMVEASAREDSYPYIYSEVEKVSGFVRFYRGLSAKKGKICGHGQMNALRRLSGEMSIQESGKEFNRD